MIKFGEVTARDLEIAEKSGRNPTIGESIRDAREQVLGMDNLTPREQRVLQLRFGLDGGRSHTLEEVGREFGVTRERIRQIEAKALRKLRHPSQKLKVTENGI